MKIILTEDVKKLGKKGEVIEVKDGYARNALFPKGLAVEANAVNMNNKKLSDKAEDKRRQEELDRAKSLKEIINEKKVNIPIKMGENGRVFGSVTSKEIADSIEEAYKVKIDKKKISLSQPIKALGTKTVEIKLHPKVLAEVIVCTIEGK